MRQGVEGFQEEVTGFEITIVTFVCVLLFLEEISLSFEERGNEPALFDIECVQRSQHRQERLIWKREDKAATHAQCLLELFIDQLMRSSVIFYLPMVNNLCQCPTHLFKHA